MKIYNNYNAVVNPQSNKVATLSKSIAVGILVGFVASAYRLILTKAESLSTWYFELLRAHLIWLPVTFIFLGILGYAIGFLTTKFNMISGSGIPQVKGIIMGYFKNKWFQTLVAKFAGGSAAILAGLSLGREGPSVQLGACVAEGFGMKFAASRTERRILMASGASAGLATAFNAPLAGAMFAIEEIFKYFSPVVLVSTMASAVAGDFVSKMIFGTSAVFEFDITKSVPLSGYWYLILLGIVIGALGAFYNTVLLKTQQIYKSLKWFNPKTRMIIPFLTAGVLGVVFPIVLGGGHHLLDKLNLTSSIRMLILIFIIKFLFSMISFGSGAPGGIFFPLLLIGATMGAIFGNIGINYLGFDPALFYNFVILAMVGYFTAIVRAPITGIILLVEMTGSFSQLLSLAVVSVIAFIIADILKSKPIYESLLENLMKVKKDDLTERDEIRKVTLEFAVQHGSPIEKKLIKDIDLPPNCLLIAIRRESREFIPNGNTRILSSDFLVVLTSRSEEANVRMSLLDLTEANEKAIRVKYIRKS